MAARTYSPLWMAAGTAGLALTVVSAWVYASAQRPFGQIADWPFMLFLVANAVLVFWYGLWIRKRLLALPRRANEPEATWLWPDPQALADSVFEARATALAALGFAAVLGGAVLIAAPWTEGPFKVHFPIFVAVAKTAMGGEAKPATPSAPGSNLKSEIPQQSTDKQAAGETAREITEADARDLNRKLAVFVFSANVVIGLAIATLARFWTACGRELTRAGANIHNTARRDVGAFVDITHANLIAAATISALALFSLLFSRFAMGEMILAFTGFTLLFVAAAYYVPFVMLSVALRNSRRSALDRVEQRIVAAHERALAATTPEAQQQALDELEGMRKVHGETLKIRTLPPGGELSIFATSMAGLLTFLPSVVRMLVNLGG